MSLIVGIGASAGGLAAFRAFLSHMPPGSGMAFVLVQHLAPDHKSILTELLGKVTAMPVIEAEDGMLVEPNQVFVIPPDCTLGIGHRHLQLARPAPPRELRRPIDTFFSSLAAIRETLQSALSWLVRSAHGGQFSTPMPTPGGQHCTPKHERREMHRVIRLAPPP